MLLPDRPLRSRLYCGSSGTERNQTRTGLARLCRQADQRPRWLHNLPPGHLYLLPEGNYKICEGVTRHTEAPALFKLEGEYIMLGSGSTGWAPNAARGFYSKSLYGPWTAYGNPVSGTNPHNGLGVDKTFGGQSNFILKVEGRNDAYIAMFDINKPDHPYESGYIWLPITLNDNEMSIPWLDSWSLNIFN